MIKKHFSLEWRDISFEKQQDMIGTIVETIRPITEEAGKKYLAKQWYNPQPKSWQEAYIRELSIDYSLWSDYHNRVRDAHMPTDQEWKQYLDDHLEKQAEKLLSTAVRKIEMEVTI